MKKQPKIGIILIYSLVILLGVMVISYLTDRSDANELPYSEVFSLFETEQVKSFELKDNTLRMELRAPYKGNREVYAKIADYSIFYDDLNDLVREQAEAGILESYAYPPDSEPSILITILPYLLLGALFLFVLFILLNRANGGQAAMRFGKASARVADGKDKVTFQDVAGAEEEKAELAEIVDFLRSPQKYIRMGAKIPKGVLLVGPPGTGKTLIAKAVAGESNVQFLSISGSEFVELYVGVGASRVRDLFDQAKKMAPAIIFIDEIDAVGRRRGAGLGGGHDEREQTLNQLLVEMDGFEKNSGIVVLAATNRKDILDPALLRPGRFDRQVYIGPPDSKGREAILKVHSKDKPLAEDVDLHILARATIGFTGADIANLLNEAALLAARCNHRFITMPDLEESMLKVIAGPEKRSQLVSPRARKLTAIHEAGHAIAIHFSPTCDPVHQITIIPRGNAGGLTLSLPKEDQSYDTRQEMFESIIAALGGRVAEQLRLNDISTGASSDIQRASAIARDMVTRYGMSDKLGTISYSDGDEIFVGRDYEKTRTYSERTAGSIDEEVKAIIDAAYEKCTAILTEHGDKLDAVADYLLEHEHMSHNQFIACMEGREIPDADNESLFSDFTDAPESE